MTAKKEKLDFKLSVIIKTFNSENTLCNLLESIKDVSEIIIIDEHSTDDTVEIAKTYKAKVVYSTKGELISTLNQVVLEAQNEWLLVLYDNEILPQKLLFEINKYIEFPKKNRNAITLPLKTFYFEKEIKAARNNKILRLFRKGACEFCSNFEPRLKLKQGKVHNINKNFRIKNSYLYSYFEPNILKRMNDLLESIKIKTKRMKVRTSHFVFKPILIFIYYFFIKGAIFDFNRGFIYSIQKYIEEFLKQVVFLEKIQKGENNDI